MGNWEKIARDLGQGIFVANLLGNSGLRISHCLSSHRAFRFPLVPLPPPTRTRVRGYLLV